MMLPNTAEAYQSEKADQRDTPGGVDRSLQAVLWTLWLLAVAGIAFWNWSADLAAQRPVNVVGIVVYSLLGGLVGLLVITLVELWLEPHRFLD